MSHTQLETSVSNEEIVIPVRVGIIGLGNIGTHHAERVIVLGHDLVGGVDIDLAVRKRFEAQFGIPTYASYDALYDAGIDAVFITTPNRFHEEYAIPALESGTAVFIEKPLAHTVESAERIAAAARVADEVCMVGFNNRFSAAATGIAADVAAGRFGELTHVEANYIRRRGIPDGSWFTRQTVAGGGALIDIGVHAIDLALYFLGFPEPEEVLGVVRSEFGSQNDSSHDERDKDQVETFDIDDSASAFIRCADNTSISLEVAWATNRPPSNKFIIRGTKAGAIFDRDTGELTIYETDGDGTKHFHDTQVPITGVDTHEQQDDAFLRAVATYDPPETNLVEQALCVQRVIDAIYRSSDRKSAVHLPPGICWNACFSQERYAVAPDRGLVAGS